MILGKTSWKNKLRIYRWKPHIHTHCNPESHSKFPFSRNNDSNMQEIIVKLQMGTDGSHSRINPYLTWLSHQRHIWRLEETGKLPTSQIFEQTNLICISLANIHVGIYLYFGFRFFWIIYILRLRNAYHKDNHFKEVVYEQTKYNTQRPFCKLVQIILYL